MNTQGGALVASYGTSEDVRVELFNESTTYGYSNLFQVRVRVSARFSGQDEPYERVLERLGVSADDLPRVRSELISDFERNMLPYLLRADFPHRLSLHQSRKRGKVVPFTVRS